MTRKIIPLNDSNWRFGSVAQKQFSDVNDLADVTEWLPARVPGDVRLDLLRAGKIDEPFFADNNEASQWIDTRDWWYVRDLDLDLEKDERAFLIFDGIDYQSAVFFNGKQLARHTGMFSRQIIELPNRKSKIENQKSQLAVRIWGSAALPKLKRTLAQQLWARLVKPLYTSPSEPFPDRYATLKCQMQFGWDFAPRLRTCGIWDDASVVIARSVFVEDVWVKSKFEIQNSKFESARVQVILLLDSDRVQNARVVCNVRGKNFADDARSYTFDLNLARGTQVREVEFDLPEARLWNPWDRGEPNLYEMDIVIARSGATKQSPIRDLGIASQTALAMTNDVLDSCTTTFGIRDFSLARVPHAPITAEPWQFVINGQREFLRGANWVPLDAIPARLTRDDYAARLQQARDANINFLRVWGGGLREKRAFYDLCDELGILVWQEFPFSANLLAIFPRDPTYLKLVHAECDAIVRALRNHPSLVVWCGGNEFNPYRNAHLVKALDQVVATNDGTRPFKPVSPSAGESHNWRVWHGYFNTREYRKDKAAFFGEFGLQAPPSPAALARFLPPDRLWPPGKMWEYHNAELAKLWRYAHAINPDAGSLEDFVEAAQMAQLRGLQVAIEHARRNRQRIGGCSFWQFNEPWPSINWSVVDYAGQPKSGYHKIKQVYNPILISLDYELKIRSRGERVRGALWLINDTLNTIRGDVVGTQNGACVFSSRVEVGPNAVENLGTLSIQLSEQTNELLFALRVDRQTIATNEYDLNYCDASALKLFDALKMTALTWLK